MLPKCDKFGLSLTPFCHLCENKFVNSKEEEREMAEMKSVGGLIYPLALLYNIRGLEPNVR
jgi:hypothetical protein